MLGGIIDCTWLCLKIGCLFSPQVNHNFLNMFSMKMAIWEVYPLFRHTHFMLMILLKQRCGSMWFQSPSSQPHQLQPFLHAGIPPPCLCLLPSDKRLQFANWKISIDNRQISYFYGPWLEKSSVSPIFQKTCLC